MYALATAFPILPGKTEEWKKFAASFLTEHRAAYEASRRAFGVHKEVATLQQTPMGDFAVVYTETDGPIGELFQKLAASNEPFDVMFRNGLVELHGLDVIQPPPGPPSETVHNWGDM